MKWIVVVSTEEDFCQRVEESWSERSDVLVLSVDGALGCLARLKASRVPDLVIVGPHSGGIDGIVRLLSLQRWKGAPWLLLQGEGFDAPALAEGTRSELLVWRDDCLELRSRADAMLGLPASGGWLHGLCLGEFLQALHYTGRGVEVSLNSEGRQGRVVFARGQLLRAEAELLGGSSALRAMLSWQSYRFSLRWGEEAVERNVDESLVSILLRAACEGDELRRPEEETLSVRLLSSTSPNQRADRRLPPGAFASADALFSAALVRQIGEIAGLQTLGIVDLHAARCARLLPPGLEDEGGFLESYRGFLTVYEDVLAAANDAALEEALLTLSGEYHLLRRLPGEQPRFLVMRVRGQKTALGLLRRDLQEAAEALRHSASDAEASPEARSALAGGGLRQETRSALVGRP